MNINLFLNIGLFNILHFSNVNRVRSWTLQILQEQYLAKVKDQNAKRYTVISAYNGGAVMYSRLSHNQDQTVVKINQLPLNEVYQQLTKKHPKHDCMDAGGRAILGAVAEESRHYLVKVTEAQKEFWRNDGFSKK